MFKILFALYELQPQVMFKRALQRLRIEQEGAKQAKKAQRLMDSNPRPVYKIPDNIKTIIDGQTETN